MEHILGKANKAAWFVAIRVLGYVWPSRGTRLAARFYRRRGMIIEGDPAFIAATAYFDATQNYGLITLGEGCVISKNVQLLTHDWSAHCVLASLGRTATEPIGTFRPITVGPHALVGLGAILTPGVTIGRGAIVGAGAVVRGRVPAYGVAIGNPARVIGDSRDLVRNQHPAAWLEISSDSAAEALQRQP